MPTGQVFSLKDFFARARDQSSGVFEHKGAEKLPWGKEVYEHYVLKVQQPQGGTVVEHLYYDQAALNVRWLIIEGSPEMLYTNLGFKEQTFTDIDFQGLDTCAASSVLSMNEAIPL